MSTGYISLPVITDTDALIERAFANISAAIPGWVPHEGNLEVLLIEQIALMVAEATTTTSDVPAEIFAWFGGVVGIDPLPGVAETIKVLFTLASPAIGSPGYQLPAGTIFGFYFAGAAYQFQTVQDYLITTGNTSLTMTCQAIIPGSIYDLDALASYSAINLATQYLGMGITDPLVSTILLTATPETDTTLLKGLDPETTTAYLNRLNTELQLLAPRPITPNDYSAFSQNIQQIYRSLSFDGINPFTNWLSNANANFTLAATSGSAPAGWTGIGDGTNVAALSTPGTSPANYLQVTTSGTATLVNASVQTATLVNATSLIYTVGSGPSIATGVSLSSPAVIIIHDATNGDEIAVVSGAGTASTTQALTLAAPLQFAHGTSATISVLQGAEVPSVGGAPGTLGVLAPNSMYYQASTVVECGSDTTATAKPYMVALATYVDGSTRVLSSAPLTTESHFDYTSGAKTIICDIPVFNYTSTNVLAVNANSPYNVIKPNIVSIRAYVVFGLVGTTKTHYIYYNDIYASPLRFDGDDMRTLSTSYWNFIPDPDLRSFFQANTALGSWTVPTGVTVIPGYGLQFAGTGAALGSPLTAISQIFHLQNTASDVVGTSRTYTLFATVDSSYAGSTFADIAVEVWDMSTGTILVTAGPINVTVSPTVANLTTLAIPFTLTAAKDVEVRIIFNTALNVPVNSSVVVSQIGIMSSNLTPDAAVDNNDLGYSWLPGSLYSTSVFNFARMISVCPVDMNGLGVSDAIGDILQSYLASRREANFIVNVMQPAYVAIDVQWTGYVLPGYTAAAVTTAVNAAIREFLSPAYWGGGSSIPPIWSGDATTIRVFDIAGIMSSVAGMGSITTVTTRTSWPVSGSYSTSDIVLVGVAALPIAANIFGVLSTDPLSSFSGLT